MKIFDECTLEEIDNVNPTDNDIIFRLKTCLNCEPNVFAEKYKAYKQAEYEFTKIYNPFKANVLNLYKDAAIDTQAMPKKFVIGNMEITYVEPFKRTSIDTKKLKEEDPELAKKYTKQTAVEANLRINELF